MIKISIFHETMEMNNSKWKMFVIRRDSGKKLGEFKTEPEALQRAWTLVKEYGLILVEPW
jgi:hypothetical protein